MLNFLTSSSALASQEGNSLAVTPVRSFDDEVAYISGVNANGTIANPSFWTWASDNANKWGAPTAGTGATVSYAFDAASGFSATEKQTFLDAFALWAAVANVTFVETSAGAANVLLRRGHDGSAYEDGAVSAASGSTLGSHTNQAIISIDTSVVGFDLSGSLTLLGGYGMQTVIHEVGHLLGLGHGGPYNGAVDPTTDQYSAYDMRLWSIMSYIAWDDANPKYGPDYPVTGTNWGTTSFGGSTYTVSNSQTWMPLDIVAVQRLYGVPTSSVFDGGDVFGFNSNVAGPLHRFFDFATNTKPVITLFSTGTGNTFDASGFSQNATINLAAGTFSSVGGLVNNVGVATTTVIETAIGGSGSDTIYGNAFNNTLHGNDGADLLYGLAGNDLLNGGAGNDTLLGGDGSDILYGGTGDDVLFGDVGADNLYGGDGRNWLYGGDGNDILVGGADVNILIGENGDDYMYLYNAGGQAYGGAGADVAVGNVSNDVFVMGAGADVAYGYGGNDYFYMGDDNDVMYGGEGVDVLLGEAGNDYFNGGAGTDYLFLGAAGSDTIWFAAGDGVDVVNDFHPGEDIAVLVGTSLHNFANVVAAATDYGSFTVVTTGAGEAIWFIGLHTSDLRSSDFYFY